MCCRKVTASVVPATYPSGGSSHGMTCCVCARPITHRLHPDEPERIFDYAPTPYLRVIVTDYYYGGRGSYVREGLNYPHSGQVCSESCAAVYAAFVGEAYNEQQRWVSIICPAHNCVQVEWVEGVAERVAV